MNRDIYYPREWTQCVDRHEKNIADGTTARWDGGKRGQEIRMALGSYKLRCFANRLQIGQGAIWERMDWKDALRLHLLKKHHWHLDQLRGIDQEEDFLFLLHDDLIEMKLTLEEAEPVRLWTEDLGSRSEYEEHFEANP